MGANVLKVRKVLFCEVVSAQSSMFYRSPAVTQGAKKNYSIDSFSCFPPRKSLVKGEIFVRVEGKPELGMGETALQTS